MGGTKTAEAAEARRHPHRATGVGAETEVGQAGRDGHRRSTRRAARQARGTARIDRRPVVLVLAFKAEGQFVGDGLADHRRTGLQEALHDDRRRRRPLLLPVPVGIAATGDGARDVDQVFYNEGETVEGARPRGRDPHPRSGNEGAEVGDGHRKALTIVSVGAVQPTMPPWARIIARVAALNWGK